jgi:SAM-dependent methyltransferase
MKINHLIKLHKNYFLNFISSHMSEIKSTVDNMTTDEVILRNNGISERFIKEKKLWNDRKRYFLPCRSNFVANNIFRLILPLLNRKKKILDIGCAFGDFMTVLNHMGHDTVGVTSPDLSEDFLLVNSLLKQNVILHNCEKTLPFEDKSFDIIVCFSVLTFKNFRNKHPDIIKDFCRVADSVCIKLHDKMMDYHELESASQVLPEGVNVAMSNKTDVVFSDKPINFFKFI